MLKIRNSYIELPKHLGTLTKVTLPATKIPKCLRWNCIRFCCFLFGFIVFWIAKPYFSNKIAISTLGSEATFMHAIHASWSHAPPQDSRGQSHLHGLTRGPAATYRSTKHTGPKATFMTWTPGAEATSEALNTHLPKHPRHKQSDVICNIIVSVPRNRGQQERCRH